MCQILIVRGPPGVGKSELCLYLEQQQDGCLIQGDQQWTAGGFNGATPTQITPARNLFLSEIAQQIEEQSRYYPTIIFDWYLPRQKEIETLLNALPRDCEVQVIRLQASLGICQKRNAQRESSLSTQQLKDAYLQVEPFQGETVIDTTTCSIEQEFALVNRELTHAQPNLSLGWA